MDIQESWALNAVRLAPAGEELCPYARRILNDADEAKRAVNPETRKHAGTLRVGQPPSSDDP
jgi:DNA-binding transcriptional LysR family regulator